MTTKDDKFPKIDFPKVRINATITAVYEFANPLDMEAVKCDINQVLEILRQQGTADISYEKTETPYDPEGTDR